MRRSGASTRCPAAYEYNRQESHFLISYCLLCVPHVSCLGMMASSTAQGATSEPTPTPKTPKEGSPSYEHQEGAIEVDSDVRSSLSPAIRARDETTLTP